MVDRMKVPRITLPQTAKLEHSSIKIHLKASMEEEISALLVSTRMHGSFTNLQKTSRVNNFYRSSKT